MAGHVEQVVGQVEIEKAEQQEQEVESHLELEKLLQQRHLPHLPHLPHLTNLPRLRHLLHLLLLQCSKTLVPTDQG
jgi:hypothetical protein